MADVDQIQIKVGLEANLTPLLSGEPALSSDSKRLYIGNVDGTNVAIPNKEDIATLQSSVDGAVATSNIASSNIATALINANAAKNESDATQSQVANIVNSNGNGTKDTELIDTRTDAVGKVWDSVGDHVRNIDTGVISALGITSLIGNLTTLTTTAKDTIVNSVNEINGKQTSMVNQSALDNTNLNITNINNTLTSASTLITSFYLSTDTSANDMIERAIASSPAYTNLVLPRGEYTTIRPIIIPDGTNFVGVGSSTVIKPDFSKWQGADYRVVILKGKEGINKNYNSYNKIVGDFNISGVNANLVKATGVFVGTDQTIDVGVAVNYAMVNGLIRNIYVEQLDTGFYFKEFDQSDAINIQAMSTRVGVLVNGKSVNSNFECKLYNSSKAFTTDTSDNTIGFDCEQRSDYSSSGVGRPEGISILPGTLIYGYFNNVLINSALSFTMSGCIIDGGVDTCLTTGGLYVDGFTASRNWFYTSSTSASCILINANGGNTNSSIILDSNRIVGATGAKGIECENHYFIEITKNDISGFSSPIWLNNCSNFIIRDNHGHGNQGTFIYNQTSGSDSIIDGNSTSDNYKVLVLQPSTISTLEIGNNSSFNSATFYQAKATIAAGQTSVSCGAVFGVILNTDYIMPMVNFSVYNSALTTQVIKWTQNANQITFTLSATSSTATTIYFQVTAIPYALF